MQCESIHCSISEQRGRRFIRLANPRSPLHPPSTKVRTLNKRELSWHIHSSRRITILMVFFHTAELVESIENWGCFYSQSAQRQGFYQGSIHTYRKNLGSQSTPSFTSLVLNNSLVNCCYKQGWTEGRTFGRRPKLFKLRLRLRWPKFFSLLAEGQGRRF